MKDQVNSDVEEIQDITKDSFTLDALEEEQPSNLKVHRRHKVQCNTDYTLFAPKGVPPSDHALFLTRKQLDFLSELKAIQLRLPKGNHLYHASNVSFRPPKPPTPPPAETPATLQEEGRQTRQRRYIQLPLDTGDLSDELPEIFPGLPPLRANQKSSDEEYEPQKKRSVKRKGKATNGNGTKSKRGKLSARAKDKESTRPADNMRQEVITSTLDNDAYDFDDEEPMLCIVKKSKKKQASAVSHSDSQKASEKVREEAPIDADSYEPESVTCDGREPTKHSESSFCRYCNQRLSAEEVAAHAETCNPTPRAAWLSSRPPIATYGRNKQARSPEEPGPSAAPEPDIIVEDDPVEERGMCPICGESEVQSKLQEHVNLCLDKQS